MPIAPVLSGPISHLLHRLRRHDHSGIADDSPVSSPYIIAFRSSAQTINTGQFTTVALDVTAPPADESGLGLLEVVGSRVRIAARGTYLASWRVTVVKTDNNPIDTADALVVGVLELLDASYTRLFIPSQVSYQPKIPSNSAGRENLNVGATVLVPVMSFMNLPCYLELKALVWAPSLTQVNVFGNDTQRGYTHLHVVRVDGRVF